MVGRNNFSKFVISFYTCKQCTQVFETIKFPSEYPDKTQFKIRLTNFPSKNTLKVHAQEECNSPFSQSSSTKTLFGSSWWVETTFQSSCTLIEMILECDYKLL